jgi:molecular chaperone IbpA
MAVAGFGAGDLDITVKENTLVISGKSHKDDEAVQYLYRGIARRAFERRFQLADHLKVAGASLDNGLLHVDLVREVPEAMKPRKIAIEASVAPKVIEQKAA